jgi:hypothetical protein
MRDLMDMLLVMMVGDDGRTVLVISRNINEATS